jgi:hypothetical protein
MKSARGARFTRGRGRGESQRRLLSAKFAQNSLFAILACPSANRPIGLPHTAQNFLPVLLSVPHFQQRISPCRLLGTAILYHQPPLPDMAGSDRVLLACLVPGVSLDKIGSVERSAEVFTARSPFRRWQHRYWN